MRIGRGLRSLLIGTTAFEALRMGASVFRAWIDLPARAELGPVAFSQFSRATDLSTRGIIFYAVYGVGGALLTCTLWLVCARTDAPRFLRRLSAVSAVSSLLILVFTTQAAPLMFRIGASSDDPALLAPLLQGFVLWTWPRLVLACISFAAVFTALARLAWSSTES